MHSLLSNHSSVKKIIVKDWDEMFYKLFLVRNYNYVAASAFKFRAVSMFAISFAVSLVHNTTLL